jgi:UDP-GlcNAc3NAcA epimerase
LEFHEPTAVEHRITLRKETEWIELVENGFNKIAGSKIKDLSLSFQQMMLQKPDFSLNLYGDGNAGKQIVSILSEKNIGKKNERIKKN